MNSLCHQRRENRSQWSDVNTRATCTQIQRAANTSGKLESLCLTGKWKGGKRLEINKISGVAIKHIATLASMNGLKPQLQTSLITQLLLKYRLSEPFCSVIIILVWFRFHDYLLLTYDYSYIGMLLVRVSNAQDINVHFIIIFCDYSLHCSYCNTKIF